MDSGLAFPTGQGESNQVAGSILSDHGLPTRALLGLATSSPPQFGQMADSASAHPAQ
jgi:hypothetical protein